MSPVIGVDLGGSKVAGAVISPQGTILQKIVEPTVHSGREELLHQISRIITSLSASIPDINAIGIGTPGYVDSKIGMVLLATNLPGWENLNLKCELEQRLGNILVLVENDANAAALGEAYFGAGRGLDDFLMITLGTGVGGAIYHKSLGIWHGSSYRAGEFGHTILYPNGRPCGCGLKGCVEQYLSGKAVERNYADYAGRNCSASQVLELASRGEPTAKYVMASFFGDLLVMLSTLSAIFDPSAIIIGGGLMNSSAAWWPMLKEQYQGELRPRLLPAQLGNDAGLFGAAWQAKRALNESYN